MVTHKNIYSTCLPALKLGHHPPAAPYDADIIILTRNRLAETIEAVNSALAQKDVRLHISVLDQGSDLDTRIRFAEAFRFHKNFSYYTVTENLGVGGGRNFLSALGQGKIIIGLDNDAVFADATVAARAVRAFDESPALGALGFKILSGDGIHLDECSWGYPAGLKPLFDDRFDTTTFVGAGHAIRRAAWSAAGGYDADLFFTWEEYDFALRAIALGWLIRCDGGLAVIHKVCPEARVQWSWERTRLFMRNRLILARKWNLSWAQLSPRICVYLIKALRNGCLMPAFAGLFAAVKQDRSLIKHAMNPHMISYIYRNETRFHEKPLEYFSRYILPAARRDV
jgi:GT2 family glycosyltransferase